MAMPICQGHVWLSITELDMAENKADLITLCILLARALQVAAFSCMMCSTCKDIMRVEIA